MASTRSCGGLQKTPLCLYNKLPFRQSEPELAFATYKHNLSKAGREISLPCPLSQDHLPFLLS